MVRYKLLGAVAAVILALWFLMRRAMAATAEGAPKGATGDVEAGIPTVKGSGSENFGGADYGVAANASDAESDVERAIRESNQAIADYEVPANPWGID